MGFSLNYDIVNACLLVVGFVMTLINGAWLIHNYNTMKELRWLSIKVIKTRRY